MKNTVLRKTHLKCKRGICSSDINLNGFAGTFRFSLLIGMFGSLLSENEPGKKVVDDLMSFFYLNCWRRCLYFCNIFWLASLMRFSFSFSDAVTQFLEVIKLILSRIWFFAYAPEFKGSNSFAKEKFVTC